MRESLKKHMACNGQGCRSCDHGMVVDITEWKRILRAGGGLALRIVQDNLDVTPSREPDPDWRQMDKSGHLHRWRFHPQEDSALVPTLRWIEDHPATDEYPAEGHHECNQCGETIEPGYRSVETRRHKAGLKEYLINGESVSQRTYEAVARLMTEGG